MNEAQLSLLEEYIGENGNFTSTVLEANQLDMPSKILYLNKAITEDSINFEKYLEMLKKSLDKLNAAIEDPQEKIIKTRASEELITSLKVIHDLYYNNELSYAYGGRFLTVKPVRALDHYFKGTGEIKPEEFKQKIQSSLEQIIKHHEHLYYSQFTAEFWKNSLRNEFILKQDNLDEIENNHLANQENPILKAKFWQEIYKQIENEVYKHVPADYLDAIKAVAKGDDGYFKEHPFLYNYLYCYLEEANIEGIQSLGGDLIDFATRRNNQNLLDIMFKAISPLDKRPDAGWAICLQHMGNSFFHQAVALRQMSEIKKLICEEKVDVNFSTYSLQTPLALACRYGHLEVVEFLLANNADINQSYGMGEHYPLQAALDSKHFVIAKLLVDQGANIFLKRGDCFLFDYCLNNRIEAERFLLEYTNAKFNIYRLDPSWNYSPMSIAYKNEHPELINLLNEYRNHNFDTKKPTQSEKNELAASPNQLAKKEVPLVLIDSPPQNSSLSFFANSNSQNQTQEILEDNVEESQNINSI